MAHRRKRPIALRKEPKQARSANLVSAILEAAVRILKDEGLSAFTTPHVAQVAGVSVGSLYQYFPNKESILLRLQHNEWNRTSALLEAILRDKKLTPELRIRRSLRAFFRSEREETSLRQALEYAAPSYNESAEVSGIRSKAFPILLQVITELSPNASTTERRRAAEVFMAAKATLGKHFSEVSKSEAALDGWADSVADMVLAYFAATGTQRMKRTHSASEIVFQAPSPKR